MPHSVCTYAATGDPLETPQKFASTYSSTVVYCDIDAQFIGVLGL
jgi:hypothetical protein